MYGKRIEVLKEFIKAGGDVNVSNQHMETALFLIAIKDNEEKQRGKTQEDRCINKDIVKVLIDAGVDVNRKNLRGVDALSVASDDMREFIVDYTNKMKVNSKVVGMVKGRDLF